ncbi:hypothetical protein IMZ29_15005 [Achromobacter sp. GG226]|uniref:hypothetical protein n=1 Tax=Verticiella alkaliphila TaxID=2779529 RepID=UPI001C0BE62B|nr:hypothetical protein [Verticiella sp. GG226]MBU4611797.1 hypothetical protein [Verticiella sp. GG226]
MRLISLVTLSAVLQGCAYTSVVSSADGSAEIMPSRKLAEDATVRVHPELSGLRQKVNLGHVCGAHNYAVDWGGAVSESISKTLEGGFRHVSRSDSVATGVGQGYALDFSLSEAIARLRFIPGFFVATAEAHSELAIRMRASDSAGNLLYQGTARGEGRADTSGGCDIGEQVVSEASRKALQRTMEDMAQKLINSGILAEQSKPGVSVLQPRL